MKSLGRIKWIDDNPDRKHTADIIGAEFIDVHQSDILDAAKLLLEGDPPRLLIIDHVLDKTKLPLHPLSRYGSTIAEALKETWPNCPIVGVTNAPNIREIDLRTKGVYDALFPYDDIGKYISRIKGIELGFEAMFDRAKSADGLVSILRPPKSELERLQGALDTDLRNAQDPHLMSRMYRWTETLIDRPGFLLDCLWSATFLGINEEGFRQVQSAFETAKYRGAFSRPDDPRWWSGILAELLYKSVESNYGELSWHLGRKLPGIEKAHYSCCYACEEAFPEIVAYLDELRGEQYAMHLGCTVLHPGYSRKLYFEDIRMMGKE